MNRLGHEYSIDIRTAHFKFTPYHKFNFIIDKSGLGKTVLLKEIAYNGVYTDMRVFYGYGDINIITHPSNYLIIFDEAQIFKFIDQYGISVLNKSDNTFLIFCRDLLDFTSIDYRAIYVLHSNKSYYTIERKYPDYSEFKANANYITEDSNFGYKYFNSKLDNVISANGKNNIHDMLEDGTTIIADGSAFANELKECLHSRKKVNYFLPDSFEGLVLEHTPSAKELVDNAHKDPVLKYLSIERYYSDNITKFYPGYSKSDGSSKVMEMELLGTDYRRLIKEICDREGLPMGMTELYYRQDHQASDEGLYEYLCDSSNINILKKHLL